MNRNPLAHSLLRVAGPLLRQRVIQPMLAGVTVALAGFALAAWSLRLAPQQSGGWTLAVWLWAMVALLIGGMVAWRIRRRFTPEAVAAELEQQGSWRKGALGGLLTPTASGTSAALLNHALELHSQALVERGGEAIYPRLRSARLLVKRMLLGVGACLLALLAARPFGPAASTLWNPRLAWAALVTPLELKARNPEVLRGESAVLEVRATGHRTARLFTRIPGEEWHDTIIPLNSEGRAIWTTQPLESQLTARLEAGGRSSAQVLVGVRLPIFLDRLTLTADYPDYLEISSEQLPLLGDTLTLPAGTKLMLSGSTTGPLSGAELEGRQGSLALKVDGTSFDGGWQPAESGSWTLLLRDSSGTPLSGSAPVIPVHLLPDSAPVAEILVPGGDLTAPASLRLDLLISLRDDHQVSAAALELRSSRDSATRQVLLNLGEASQDRALLNSELDLAALQLGPGDTLFYRAVAFDNSPARQAGRSLIRAVRIPTEKEQRLAQRESEVQTAAALDSLSARSQQLQRQGEDLSQERQRAQGGGAGQPEDARLSAEAARRAERVLESQQALLQQATQLERQLEELRRSAELSGGRDSALINQFNQVRDLIRRADSPELRTALQALQQALERLDPSATRTALQDLAQRQAEYRNAVEQARELFQRAALEGELRQLESATGSLLSEQQLLTPELSQTAADPADPGLAGAAARQDSLAARADSLASSFDSAAHRMPTEAGSRGLQGAADSARQAAEEMRQAASAARQGKQSQAEQGGKGAERQLQQLEQATRDQRQSMQQQLKDEVLKELDRSLAETVQLVEMQVRLTTLYRRGGMLSMARNQQILIDEALGRVISQVNRVAGKNALVPQQIGISLASGRARMRQAIEYLSSISPDGGSASVESGEAVDALNLAGFAMLRARERVSGAESGSGMKEALEELQRAAEAQGRAAQGAGEKLGGDTPLQQMLELAAQQRAVATQLDRLRAGGEIPGAGLLAEDARELARQLEAGLLDQGTVDRQQKLYRRLLDAGRQLQGQDDDEVERKSVTAGSLPARLPSNLDPSSLQGGDLIRLPRWEVLQQLTPDQRRRVLDYFQRLIGGGG